MSNLPEYTFWNLSVHVDQKGALCPIEFSSLPFSPRRMYFIYDVKELRGGHAHTEEQEVFVCIAGSFSARIHDGAAWHTFAMNQPGQALYTDKMIWHEFDEFSPDAIMLAISSTVYNGTKGYIMELQDFINSKNA